MATDDGLVTATIATYDRIAGRFAERHQNDDFGGARVAFAHAITGPAPTERFRILDAGCGPGRDTLWFQERGFQVIGVDLSAGMLAEARRRAPGVEFRQADLRDLAFPSGYFDGIWASASLLHLPRAEVARVLESFNRLLGHGYLWLSVKAGHGEAILEQPYGSGNPRRFTYFSRPEIELYVERAGFEVRQVSEGAPTADNPTPWISVLAQTALHTPLLGAIAVIFDEAGRVLLSERADGRGWNLPAGFVDAAEAPQDAAVRETAEETGLEVQVERLIGVYTHFRRQRPDGPPTTPGALVTHAFLCRRVGGTLTPTNEALQHGWFPPEALPSPLSSRRHAEIIQDALALRAGRREPVVRRYG